MSCASASKVEEPAPEDALEELNQPQVPGRLNEFTQSSPASRDIDSVELATELLRRIRSGEGMADATMSAELMTTLALEIDTRLDVLENRLSRRRSRDQLGWICSNPAWNTFRLRGATFVELGCGSVNPLALGLVFVALGADRAFGLELDPVRDVSIAVRALGRMTSLLLSAPKVVVGDYPVGRGEIADHLETFDILKMLQGDPGGIDRRRLDFRLESASETSFADGEVDIVFSNAFLEHIGELERAIAEMARVVRPGGLTVHNIDCLDHTHYLDPTVHPLDFLTINTEDALVRGSNRLRPAQILPIFERYGFEVLRLDEHSPVTIDAAFRERLVEPFRSMTDAVLGTGGCILHCRRRASGHRIGKDARRISREPTETS